jgi:hypothetical protein
MSTLVWRFGVGVGCLLLAAAPLVAEPASTVTVSRWLVLGPAPDPLPLHGREKPGAFGIADLLDAARFAATPWRPVEGETVSWFGRDLVWTARTAGEDGTVALDSPEAGPASAWLAVYVNVPRWQSGDVELLGTHPRRAWLGPEAVARGGIGARQEEPDPVKGKVKLPAGTHVLIVRAVYDPEVGGTWKVGARLRATGDDALTIEATTAPARSLDLLDLLEPPQVTSLAVAPDGKTAAVAYRRLIAGTNDDESWVELRSTADGTVQGSWRGSSTAQVAFDPAGRWMSYVTREPARGSGNDAPRSTLWLVDRQTGETRAARRAGRAFRQSYLWSPDGRQIVFSTSTRPEADPRGVKRLEGLMDRWRDYRTRSALSLVGVPGGTRRAPDGGRAQHAGARLLTRRPPSPRSRVRSKTSRSGRSPVKSCRSWISRRSRAARFASANGCRRAVRP